MKQNILIIHPNLGVGGAEKMIAFVANALSARFNVYLALIQDTEIKLELDSSISVVQFGFNQSEAIKNMNKKEAVKYIFQLISEINKTSKKNNIDMLLSFDDRISVFSWISAKMLKIPVFFSQRADPYDKPLIWQKITNFIYKYSSGVVFQTVEASEFYEVTKNRPEITDVIPNPAINRESVSYGTMELPDNCIVSAGRFQYRKGFDVLIKAFSIVQKKYPYYKLVIFGDGEERNNLLNLVKKLNLTKSVLLPGNVNNVMENSKNAEMFVLSSRSEGIPNILIEALLEGIPCISTDCSPGGARLLLNNGDSGLLVPNEDYEALASAIIEYIEDPLLKEQKAGNATKWISNFDSKEIGDKWLSFFNKRI